MKKLELGQSFEVVEVVNSNFPDGVYKVGGYTIMFSDYKSLINGFDSENIDCADIILGQKCFCLLVDGEKPVGRLIIKSVK